MAGIIRGLFAARSGLQSFGTGLSIIADNIANVQTTGHKARRANFADLLAGSLSGSSGGAGSGSSVIGVTPILTQGSFVTTGRGLDLGIAGQGFFMVQDPSTSERLYSRSGNFQVGTDGSVLDQNGLQVLGYPSGGGGGLQALNVNDLSQASIETSEINVTGNLDASSPIVPPGSLPIAGASTFSDYAADATLSSSVEVYDSLGASHTVTTYFYHTAATPSGQFEYRSVIDGADVGGVAGAPVELGAGTIAFDSDGSRTAPVPAVDAVLAPAYSNGANSGSLSLSFSGFTQFASSSNVSSLTQNGTGQGSVTGFSVDSDGTLVAELDNAQRADIGTVGLANFANPEGLEREGDSLYAATGSSGAAVAGAPGVGGFGDLESGALELSNVDLATEFINSISYQRGFEANARIVRQIDELLQEIIGLG